MLRPKVNFREKFGLFADQRAPRVVAQMNDYQFKLVRVQGEFVWHSHADTDETFIILEGALRIELRDGAIDLGAGELFVVPRGVEHRPVAEHECLVMLVEPSGTRNTGDAGGPMTAPDDVWI
jgi:mannose-6-phosphate isomerase-like protein (cupin superfamily)